MASEKLTDLSSIGSVADDDLFYVVPAAGGTQNKATRLQVVTGTNPNVQSGPIASLPSPGVEGTLYFPTDSIFIYRDTGSAWGIWGTIYPLVNPNLTSWSWVNQGAATLDTTKGGIFLSQGSTGGSDSVVLRVTTIPVAPYTMTAYFHSVLPYVSGGGVHVGTALYDSGTGKTITYTVSYGGGIVAYGQNIYKWNNPTSFNNNYFTGTLPLIQISPLWHRIQDDGANRIFSVSTDGLYWTTYQTISNTDFLTPNQIGFFIDATNTSDPQGINLVSWKMTTP